MAAVFLLCGVCIFGLSAGQTTDQTLVPGTSGAAVVQAVVGKIQLSGIFPNDNWLLRRIAYVESKDGTDEDTYRVGYDGGIWQIDLFRFASTKNSGDSMKYEQIFTTWGISWLSVSWNDLRKPFYSGLAASLILSAIDEPVPLASQIEVQGNYWKTYYNSDAADTVQQFVNDVIELEETTECQTGIDLIFVLDSSGSIGSYNFELMKNFTANVVKNLDIRPDEARVGVILFNSFVSVQFSLNSYTTNSSLLEAIANITYTGGGTNTGAAILTCIEQFNTSFGARPKSSGIPRIAIVVTDGKSNDPPTTIAAAEIAHSEGILSYAVGIGGNVNMEELKIIATDPDSQYVRSVAEFSTSELKSLQETLNKQACTAPAISAADQVITNTLQQNEATFLQVALPEEGITFSLDVSQGSVVMYGSNKIQNPNAAFHDFMLSESQPEIFVNEETFSPSTGITKRQITNNTDDIDITIYITIQGQSVFNNFTLNTTTGDTTEYIEPTEPATNMTTIRPSMTTDTTDNMPPPMNSILPIALGSAAGAVAIIMIIVVGSIVSFVVCRFRKKAKEHV